MVKRTVNTTLPDMPKWLDWSEQSITWSPQDHPPRVDYLGKSALVVVPQVKGYVLTKTLMDGGSNINILYYERMGLRDEQMVPTITSFHGIVPRKNAYLLGKITLDVVFGTAKNFRLKRIGFEVVNFHSSYHAILGRPAFAKFMARPCYAYLKMKMPGHNGTIFVHSDIDRAIECEKGNAVLPSPSSPWSNLSSSSCKSTPTT